MELLTSLETKAWEKDLVQGLVELAEDQPILSLQDQIHSEMANLQ